MEHCLHFLHDAYILSTLLFFYFVGMPLFCAINSAYFSDASKWFKKTGLFLIKINSKALMTEAQHFYVTKAISNAVFIELAQQLLVTLRCNLKHKSVEYPSWGRSR